MLSTPPFLHYSVLSILTKPGAVIEEPNSERLPLLHRVDLFVHSDLVNSQAGSVNESGLPVAWA
jgi:hypothetical protein